MSEPKGYPVESMIIDLRKIIEELETETFEGVLLYSNHNKRMAWAQMVKGDAKDRLIMVDAALMSMDRDPIQESRDWFFSQIYERFKMLRPSTLAEDKSVV